MCTRSFVLSGVVLCVAVADLMFNVGETARRDTATGVSYPYRLLEDARFTCESSRSCLMRQALGVSVR